MLVRFATPLLTRLLLHYYVLYYPTTTRGTPCETRLGTGNVFCAGPDNVVRPVDGKAWSIPSPTCMSRFETAQGVFDYSCPVNGELGVPCIEWGVYNPLMPLQAFMVSYTCDGYKEPVNASEFTEMGKLGPGPGATIKGQVLAASEEAGDESDGSGTTAVTLGAAVGGMVLVISFFWYFRSRKTRKKDKVRSAFGDTFDV